MGVFKNRSAGRKEFEQLRSEIESVRLRVSAVSSERGDLAELVDGLVARLDVPMDAPAPEPPPAVVDAQTVQGLRSKIDMLMTRLDGLDARVTAISSELANQIEELSSDIGTGSPSESAVVDELRAGQERLANEQARYQIAFRQDLAELVERLRKS